MAIYKVARSHVHSLALILTCITGYICIDFGRILTEGEEPEIGVIYAAIDSETHPKSDLSLPIQAAKSYNLLTAIHPLEIKEFIKGYDSDPYFSRVCTELCQEQDWKNLQQPLFSEREDGMLMFEGWNGNFRLCVPKNQRNRILSETHDELTGVAHTGYHRTYNRLASIYYWPQMSRDIK